ITIWMYLALAFSTDIKKIVRGNERAAETCPCQETTLLVIRLAGKKPDIVERRCNFLFLRRPPQDSKIRATDPARNVKNAIGQQLSGPRLRLPGDEVAIHHRQGLRSNVGMGPPLARRGGMEEIEM